MALLFFILAVFSGDFWSYRNNGKFALKSFEKNPPQNPHNLTTSKK
jgi:hypothetical protein